MKCECTKDKRLKTAASPDNGKADLHSKPPCCCVQLSLPPQFCPVRTDSPLVGKLCIACVYVCVYVCVCMFVCSCRYALAHGSSVLFLCFFIFQRYCTLNFHPGLLFFFLLFYADIYIIFYIIFLLVSIHFTLHLTGIQCLFLFCSS